MLGVLLVALATASCAGDDDRDAVTTAPRPASTAPTASTTSTPSTPSTTAGSTAATDPTSAPATTTTTPPPDPASALARRLEVAERGIRDETLDAATRAAHGRDQQAAYRAAGSDRDLIARLPGLVADDVRAPVAFNLAARTAVLDHAASRPDAPPPPPTLPAWTIVEPPPIDELLGYYREAQDATGVGWEWLAAIHLQETRMGRIVGTSSAGAVGPMQFLPSTWAACCQGDPTVARDAILGAATYLAQSGAPADMDAAVHAYNPNDGYVGAVTAYAANLRADPTAYVGYHAWEVYVATSAGTVHLPVGYAASEPVDAATWLAQHPSDPPG